MHLNLFPTFNIAKFQTGPQYNKVSIFIRVHRLLDHFLINQKGFLEITELVKMTHVRGINCWAWIGTRIEDLLGQTEEAQIGIIVNEFGAKCWVLMEAMEDISGMDLVEVFYVVAEI